MLEQWYKEALGCDKTAKFSSIKSNSILYKGFKIVVDLENGGIELLDIRKNDFYSKINDSDLDVISKHGFINGCNIIMKRRDLQRVNKYKAKLEKLYTLKEEYKKDSVKNKKKLGICEMNITETIDLLFFYKSRLNQNNNE